jgi:hypothetical protein
MSEREVTCITKSNPNSKQHEHITHLGNTAEGWKQTREEVIRLIDAKIYTYFAKDPYTGKRSDVVVVRPAGAVPYVRTQADGTMNDNLLSLKQCPN